MRSGHLCLKNRVNSGDLSFFAGLQLSLSVEVTRLFGARQFLQLNLRPRRTRAIRKFFYRNNACRRVSAGIACADAEYMFGKTPLKIGGDTCVVSAVLALEQI